MNVVIAAGGTGGHVYPAIALAREFLRQDPGSTVLFIGTARGIEATVLPREGFELAQIKAWGVMGRGLLKAIGGLLALPAAVWQSVSILRERQADLVIGTGGYVSPPVVTAAFLLGTPRVILEPNALPGLANKVLGPLAQRVFLGFESTVGFFQASKVKVVGIPVRPEFLGPAPAAAGRTRTLLVFGGSQGAHAINVAMMDALPHLSAVKDEVTVIHQTGDADCPQVAAAYRAAGFSAQVVPFLYNLPPVLRSADLVVCRSGAVTVAELAVAGKPAILIPLPHAIYQHQGANARTMEAAGAALVLRQEDLDGARLADTLQSLFRDPERLRGMADRSRALGRPHAAEEIVRECRELVRRDA